jgi:hypothetical protein
MDVMDINDAQQILEKEIEAENYAVPFVYGVNFSDCLRMNGIDTEIEVDGKKIQAHRIYGLWETALIGIGETTGQTTITKTPKGKEKEKPVVKRFTRFTDVADDLIKKIFAWITTDYTDPYKSIVQASEVEWLETVIRFVVYRRIMENKYYKWITKKRGFADSDVAAKIAEIYRFKYEMPYVARLIHEKLLAHKDHVPAEEWEKKLSQDIITGLFDLLRVDRLRLLPPVNPDVPQIEGEDEAV